MGNSERAFFGAGCFWGVQKDFDLVEGVVKTEAGYMGGDERKYPSPTYEQVCTEKTGYVEVVYIEYDSLVVSYDKLIRLFWKSHDPTTLNRQGNDAGEQYRSVIFYYNDKQKEIAEKSRNETEKRIGKKVVTQIVPAGRFFKAEEYHQKYLEKEGMKSCSF